MSRVLILHASRGGHTARVAERIGAVLERAGHAATVLPADSEPLDWVLERHDAVMIGGGVRYGRHPWRLESVVRNHLERIRVLPGAFFSVSLSAGGPGARPREARRYLDEFLERTGWRPLRTACIAGALQYSRYNPFTRFMMRLIVGASGGDTDAARDYEYTDWRAVEAFAAEFAATFLDAALPSSLERRPHEDRRSLQA
jgi:menaquinone-dependent protoporphyrinogen oxidase